MTWQGGCQPVDGTTLERFAEVKNHALEKWACQAEIIQASQVVVDGLPF